MEINITTTKEKALVAGDHNVTKEFIKVEISDQDLLKLGRKYFELASGNSEKETSFDEWKEKELEKDPEFAKEYMMNVAQELKHFCGNIDNCKKCQFCKNPDENDDGGTYKCKLKSGFGPCGWEV